MTVATPTSLGQDAADADRQRHRAEHEREPEADDATDQVGGVRSWNSVWLGMTKTMFATPIPNAIAEHDREVVRTGQQRS